MTVTAGNPPGDFVQVGATRDGLEPYLDAAHRRGMRTVLVETPAYLRWRKLLGRREFEVEVAVERPQDPDAVRAALGAAGVAPALVLTGFERYVYAGFALARALRVAPWPDVGDTFRPLDKREQREALLAGAPQVAQPGFVPLGPDVGDAADRLGGGDAADQLGFPQVIKPADGGGGLGVLLVDGAAQRHRALDRVGALVNYGGGAFSGIVAEEFVKGPEFSLQGVAHEGSAVLLSVCEKLTCLEEVPDEPGLSGFREVGHVARPGDGAPPALQELAQACLDATGYRAGPFHVDVIQGPDGPVFVEMGFRLSGGGLVALVEKATGADWAELAFHTHLGDAPVRPDGAGGTGIAGQISAVSEQELAAAEALQEPGLTVEIQLAAPPPDPAALPADDLPVLASDLARHTGAAGRVVLSGGPGDRIPALLHSLVADRLRG
ncbi:ATP-grasp domain-containing protein [Streptomyces sp. P9-2B-2]|uniref:ATP-grasp domain-containing protein n=1 Tax=Streptomyces sp. P9-2B-2 TaxID=3057114 RepID=UPI0025B39472|nr:ATP-grasp domain-containing protein [Streptomyces sp. P9-2B-2]WJY36224.1 ATP-grasp domain-containing protein [Streptomyces sp. P9-2B-2]